MSLPWLLFVSVFGGSAPGQGASLSAAAAASGRPRECASGSRRGSPGPSIWQLARVPNLQRYCDLVAKAQAQLATSAEAARASAKQADEVLPGHASPAIVVARAALSMGSLDEARREFERARAVDPRSLEDPATLADLARVLAKTGQREAALAAYRSLVPRIDLLATTDRKVAVLLEAAHVSMAAGASLANVGSPGPVATVPTRAQGLDEAVAYLREARQRPATVLAPDVLFSLALVLDRARETAQASAALVDAQRVGARLRPRVLDYVAVAEDQLALEALALEGVDRSAATKKWDDYLSGPGGKSPWAAAARARLDALRKGKGAQTTTLPARPTN